MKIICVGGGPAGLYFSLLMKKARPSYEVTLLERNKLKEAFGSGVVLSDATMTSIAAVAPETSLALSKNFVRWNDIEVHYNSNCTSSSGHGFIGIGRDVLINILQSQAQARGVNICFEHEETSLAVGQEADLVVAADGASSTIRSLLAAKITTTIHKGSNRFVWLKTDKVFSAFNFCFKENKHGLWCIHAYQYAPDRSTIIVECSEATWLSSEMNSATEAETKVYLEQLFAQELSGHKLLTNWGTWQQFSTICTTPWSSGQFVLLGDAAHTTHFSIGSGTSMAMDDALALCNALSSASQVPKALKQYEKTRRPQVESLQRSAHASMEWFEHVAHYRGLDPVLFSFSLLTRSMRITHEHLRTRDPKFLSQVDAAVFENAERQVAKSLDRTYLPPPMFTPFRLRDLVIPNRVVVSPMCQYVAKDGTVGDWHLVHLGSRALGGAGLLIAEMTNVNPDARISPNCAGLYKDDHLAAWKRVVEFVHRETPAKIGIQLGHAGRKGATKPPWEGNHEPLEENSWSILSASPLPYLPGHSKIPQEMTRGDMDHVVADFVNATKLAILAAFDLLEIHMAHGYLLASFISPLTNNRTDEYGGSLENRMRFPLEIFDACREVWPPHQPMSVRISAVDWAPGGMNATDAVKVATLLKAHNCDIVDVSTGQTVPEQQPNYGRLFQTPFADRIRRETNIATMAVGNISSYMDVNTIIAAGRADLCLLARAHLFDPYWTRHAAWMLDYPLPWPNPYKAMERYNPRLEFKFTSKKE